MAQKDNEAGKAEATADFIEFHYQKSPGYRSIHADGFYGGTTPRGLFSVSFFNERQVIPRRVRRPVLSQSDGQVVAGPEEAVETLEGIVRQLETTVFMDINTTREFFSWFENHVRNLEEATGVPQQERVTKPRSEPQ